MNELNLESFLGYGVGNYRSFCGQQLSYVGPFEKINIITGQNNSGKSALMNFLVRLLPQLEQGLFRAVGSPFVDDDIPMEGVSESNEGHIFRFSICYSRDAFMRDRGSENEKRGVTSSCLPFSKMKFIRMGKTVRYGLITMQLFLLRGKT